MVAVADALHETASLHGHNVLAIPLAQGGAIRLVSLGPVERVRCAHPRPAHGHLLGLPGEIVPRWSEAVTLPDNA